MTPASGPSAPVFRPRRRVLVAAVLATLLVAVLALWATAGRREVGPPLMITPALGIAPPSSPAVTPPATPSSRAASKAPRSKAASPSASPSRSARRPSATPKPRATTAPPPAVAARYVGGSARRGAFMAGVAVRNEGSAARTWEVRIAYDAGARVRVERVFGARVSTSGGTLVFTGGPLEPGREAMFAFHADTSADGQIRPASCQADGRACTITFR